jgi:hypothetical protein
MAKQTDFARALMPYLVPSDTARDELFREAGRAIVALSNIENYLALIFAVLSVPVSSKVALDLFYEARTFERRINLVDFIVRKENKQNEVTSWEAIFKRLKTHKGVRNLIAHQGLFRGESDALGNKAAFLRSPWYKASKRSKHLGIKDVMVTADALERIADDVWQLFMKMGKPS